MAPRIDFQILLLLLILAVGGICQTPPPPPPATGTARIYLLLKPGVADTGAVHDAFTQRMTALGATNLQFVTGTNAAKCEVLPAVQAAIASDPDITAVLPIDSASGPAAVAPAPSVIPLPPAPPPTPSASPIPPLPGPVFSTPPYMPPQQPMSISPSMPIGGGMSAGMALLSDFAGNLVVKLLSPGSTCKIRLAGRSPAIPAQGGAGAFEVRASGNCAWQAVSTADWLHIKTEVNAGGTVAIVYAAPPNSAGHRQAIVVIQPVAGMALKGHTVMLVSQQ